MSLVNESVLEKKVPFLKWYQNKEYVIFDVYNEISKKDVVIKDNCFNVKNINYEMMFEFFDEINEENIEIKSDQIKIRIILEKKESKKYFWTYLSKNNDYKSQIQVNWDKWVDEDEENDEEPESNQQQIDFQQMMASMGGGINFDNMGDNVNNYSEENTTNLEDVNENEENNN